MSYSIRTSILFVVIFVYASCSPALYQVKPDIPNGGRAVAVSVDPDNDNNIIVASETGGLFRSRNHGFNWEQVSGNTTFTFNDVLFLKASYRNKKIVLAAAKADTHAPNGGGVYKSIDGGSSWVKIDIPFIDTKIAKANNLDAYCLCLEEHGSRVWVGTSCGLAWSDDNGLNWTVVPQDNFVYAVTVPSKDHIIYSSGNAIIVSDDGGKEWHSSGTGIPNFPRNHSQSQIAVSPVSDKTIFWIILFSDENRIGHVGVFASLDNGFTWTEKFFDEALDQNKDPFISITNSFQVDDSSPGYDLYLGDGSETLHKLEFVENIKPVRSTTTKLTTHSVGTGISVDFTEMGFSNDKKTPLILVGDHGILLTTDKGLNWVLSGGNRGYNALQIYEVTGQLHEDGQGADIYFSTQDNYFYASPDNGATWPFVPPCCEGYDMNIPRDYYDDQVTKFVFRKGSPYRSIITAKYFQKLSSFPGFLFPDCPDAPSSQGIALTSPKYIYNGIYIQKIKPQSQWGTSFSKTINTGLTWVQRFNYEETTPEGATMIKLSGDKINPVLFIPVYPLIQSIAFPSQEYSLTLKRIQGISASGEPIISDVSGFGSLGRLHTLNHISYPFAVNPKNPQELIVPDVYNNTIKMTLDGGIKWHDLPQLYNLVTENGNFKFAGHFQGTGQGFSQVTALEFSPNCPNFIIVGTKQAGIFTSSDKGTTWKKVKGSEVIPNISTFFFGARRNKLQDVFISSFGRGLWGYTCECPPAIESVIPPSFVQGQLPPLFYSSDALFPLKDIDNSRVCNTCAFYLTDKGEILNYKIDSVSKEVKEVILSKGSVQAYSSTGQSINPSFRISYSSSKENEGPAKERKDVAFENDTKLLSILKEKLKVQGLYLEGNILKGILLYDKNIDRDSLPKNKLIGPGIKIEFDAAGTYKLYGRGFKAAFPLSINIDGKFITPLKPLEFDDQGTFVLYFRPPFEPGTHRVLVQQKNEKETIKAENSFVIQLPGDRMEQ